jgi:hypothetical protein
MSQTNDTALINSLKRIGPYLLVVAAAFFIYELYLVLNSFSAINQIYQNVAGYLAQYGFSFWRVYWLSSELVSEAGLMVRFAASCFFLAFTFVLLKRKEFALTYLRKAVFLEAIQYLFFIPFLGYLYLRPDASTAHYLVVVSYGIQILLVTPSFLILYTKLRNPHANPIQLFKGVAVAAVSFLFALWIKHFLFSLYALPINFGEPLLLVGTLNSIFTLLIASLLLLFAFMPLLKENRLFNPKLAGAALCCAGAYFIVYLLISIANNTYLYALALTELWAVSLLILGISLMKKQ